MRQTVLMMAISALVLVAVAPAHVQAGNATAAATVGEYPGGIFMSYDPATLTITAGTTVTWTNVGHQMHGVEFHVEGQGQKVVTVVDPASPTAPPDFDQDVAPGHSVSYTFTVPGVYVLNCNDGPTHDTGHQVIYVQ